MQRCMNEVGMWQVEFQALEKEKVEVPKEVEGSFPAVLFSVYKLCDPVWFSAYEKLTCKMELSKYV